MNLFLRIGVAFRASVAIFAAIFSRFRHGRGRPRWTLMHEILVTGMKREFARLDTKSWAVQRDTWKAVALPPFVVRRARFERTRWAGLNAEWITPRELVPADDGTILLYLHGGAYLFGSLEEYRDLVSRIASAAQARALVIAYRLAPEHPFPAAAEDALAAYTALLDSGIDAKRIVIAGDSAGGGLTASLLVTLRDRGLPLPAGAALISPWVDLAARGGSLEKNHPHDYFTPRLVERWANTVLAGADATDPRASPGRAALQGLPPMLVQIGGAEMILDQVVAFAERAKAAGVDVKLRVWEDCFHDWLVFAALLDDARRAIDELGAFVREVRASR